MRKLVAPMLMVTTVLLAGCSVGGSVESLPKITTADEFDSRAVIDSLETAGTITLKKDVISWGDNWTVTADGVEVAEIKGQPLYMIGDTYSMFSANGNLVGSEGEQFRLVDHKAKLYDYNNDFAGMIDQEMASVLYKFTIFDADMNKVGTMNQKLSFALTGDIKDNEGDVAWRMSKSMVSVGAKITLERKSASDVDAMSAIWMSVVMNEIAEAAEDEENDSSFSRNR